MCFLNIPTTTFIHLTKVCDNFSRLESDVKSVSSLILITVIQLFTDTDDLFSINIWQSCKWEGNAIFCHWALTLLRVNFFTSLQSTTCSSQMSESSSARLSVSQLFPTISIDTVCACLFGISYQTECLHQKNDNRVHWDFTSSLTLPN